MPNCITQHVITFYVLVTCIVTNFFLIKPTDELISQIYFCQETLHVSGSSSAHHQEFSIVLSALVYVMHGQDGTEFHHRPCLKAVIKSAWHIPVPKVQWKTPHDGQRNCPEHVEFLDKNKFGKLVRLLGLLTRNVVTCSCVPQDGELTACVIFNYNCSRKGFSCHRKNVTCQHVNITL